MIVGGILKIFRIKSIRSSIFFMIAVIVVNVLVERLYRLSGERLGVTLVDNYPSPLELQIPTIAWVYNRRCAWV